MRREVLAATLGTLATVLVLVAGVAARLALGSSPRTLEVEVEVEVEEPTEPALHTEVMAKEDLLRAITTQDSGGSLTEEELQQALMEREQTHRKMLEVEAEVRRLTERVMAHSEYREYWERARLEEPGAPPPTDPDPSSRAPTPPTHPEHAASVGDP